MSIAKGKPAFDLNNYDKWGTVRKKWADSKPRERFTSECSSCDRNEDKTKFIGASVDNFSPLFLIRAFKWPLGISKKVVRYFKTRAKKNGVIKIFWKKLRVIPIKFQILLTMKGRTRGLAHFRIRTCRACTAHRAF